MLFQTPGPTSFVARLAAFARSLFGMSTEELRSSELAEVHVQLMVGVLPFLFGKIEHARGKTVPRGSHRFYLLSHRPSLGAGQP